MASKADKRKAQELVKEVERLHDKVKTPLEKKTWAKNTLPKMDEAINLDSEDFAAWSTRGFAKNELGDHQDAIDDCTKAIEINPKYATAWNNRGGAKNELGDHQGAIDDCTKAIEIYPKHALAWNNRGFAKHKLNYHRDAIDDFNEAIELNPKDATTWNNRGGVKSDLNDYKSAIDDFDKAIEIDPKHAHAWNSRGTAKNALGDHEDAIDDYTRAIELEPQFAVAWNNRGLAKYHLGKYDDALKDSDKALSLEPDDETTQRNRQAVLLAIEGEKRKAETFEKEGKHHERLKEKAKDFRTKHDDCIQERNRLFRVIWKFIAIYVSGLVLLFLAISICTDKWHFTDFFDDPFALFPYLALLVGVLSFLAWRIRITAREAERNLILAEDYDGRLIVEFYLERFFSEESERRKFAEKYVSYWMYNNPSETLIRLANKSAEQPELSQAEQIRNLMKPTPTDQ